MSWEALRLTSRSPSEVYGTLGPHGVEEMLHDARGAVWREYPAETRSYDAVKRRLIEVLERNLKAWNAMKKPTPEAFFANLLPFAADGHVRQALVLTWMMMPRTGGRDVKDAGKIVRGIFERMLTGWDQDEATFTGRGARRPKRKAPARSAAKVVATGKRPKGRAGSRRKKGR